MRQTLFAVALALVSCSKCSKDAGVDAGSPVDAGVAMVPDASVAQAPVADAGGEPTEAELVAAYARDCGYTVQLAYYEYDQDLRGDECVARNIDQSCAPDLFGCYGKSEDCKKQCGSNCQTCAGSCAQSCTSCRSECEQKAAGERSSCVTVCAKARLMCRTTCLSAKAKCLSEACVSLETTCDNEGEARRKKSCPDCTELGQCMWEPGFKDDHEKCLTRYPENAKECLEWCFQE